MRPAAITLLLAASTFVPLGRAGAQPAAAPPAYAPLSATPPGATSEPQRDAGTGDASQDEAPGAHAQAGGPGAGEAPDGERQAGAGAGSAQVTFRVEDRRDPHEVAEATVLYVNRRAVGRFRLDAVAPDGALTVTVPAAEHYEYALCGTITIRTEAGEEVHRVNSAGQLDVVDGHVFEALGASDFTLFYLADRGGGVMPTAVRRADPGLCTPATS